MKVIEMSLLRSQAKSAFNWGERPVEPPQEPKKSKKIEWPPGTVTKSQITTLIMLAEQFAAAGGEPLRLVDMKGNLICKILEARAGIQGVLYSQHFNTLMKNLDFHLPKMGNTGVIEVIRNSNNFASSQSPPPVTVAYFVGKDFELKKA
jgi:hypothetical protein